MLTDTVLAESPPRPSPLMAGTPCRTGWHPQSKAELIEAADHHDMLAMDSDPSDRGDGDAQ